MPMPAQQVAPQVPVPEQPPQMQPPMVGAGALPTPGPLPRPPSSGQPTGNGAPSPFDGPIPGQSLTQPPGNAPFERPPQFTDPQEAAAFIFSMFLQQTTMNGMLTMLKQGMPAEALARVVLFSGFSEGKWSPDLMMLLFKPVMAMIVGLGERAKIKGMKINMVDRSSDKIVKDLVRGQTPKDMPQAANTPEDMVASLVQRPNMPSGVM